jgi:hypothetical protein
VASVVRDAFQNLVASHWELAELGPFITDYGVKEDMTGSEIAVPTGLRDPGSGAANNVPRSRFF